VAFFFFFFFFFFFVGAGRDLYVSGWVWLQHHTYSSTTTPTRTRQHDDVWHDQGMARRWERGKREEANWKIGYSTISERGETHVVVIGRGHVPYGEPADGDDAAEEDNQGTV
jgi:hypothetical protein